MSEPTVTAHDPFEELARRDELDSRLGWLVNLRWLALGGVFTTVALAQALDAIERPWPLWAVGAAMLLFNLGLYGLRRAHPERTLRALTSEGLLQIGLDVAGLGLLIFFAGGLSNPFVFFFTHHVVIAAILFDRRRAYAVAALTSAMVVLLALAEEAPWLGAWPLSPELGFHAASGIDRAVLALALILTLVFSAYMVTTIMEHLRRRGSDVRRLNADLAERVQALAAAERKLKAEHERARAILECMDEGVVVVDLGAKVLLANSAAQHSAVEALTETLRRAGALDEAARQALRKRFHDPCVAEGADPREHAGDCEKKDPEACLHDALEQGGELCPSVLMLLGADPPPPPPVLLAPEAPVRVDLERDGRCLENTVSAVRTRDGEALGVVVVSRDVTPRYSLERQVRHAEKLHAVGRLAAGAAHELNTPLGTILGYAQMLLEDGDADRARVQRDMKAVEEQARRCRRIVQGMLDFARKAGGGREPLRIEELLAKASELTAHSLEMRGIALHGPRLERPLPRVAAAANEIEQVLVNLITNAADAFETLDPPARASRGGARVSLDARAEPSGGVLIAVEDNGPGVPEALRKEVFEPFFTTKPTGKGTGLGLSIARRIVEDHGGTLQLLPRQDGQPGARFEMRLPAAKEIPAEAAAK
ncbi:MAG: ATP-binding protein [Planctomycetota bacterium]|nr:ATP-binding protein [Planctomycetota bacterium]